MPVSDSYRDIAGDMRALTDQVRELQAHDARAYAARDLILIAALERIATALENLNERLQRVEA